MSVTPPTDEEFELAQQHAEWLDQMMRNDPICALEAWRRAVAWEKEIPEGFERKCDPNETLDHLIIRAGISACAEIILNPLRRR